MCGKLKRVWYFYLYFNCQQLNYFVSYLFTEFHLAHIKHVIAIEQYLSCVYFWIHFKSGYIPCTIVEICISAHIYILRVFQNKG